jgi:hypothetical protein
LRKTNSFALGEFPIYIQTKRINTEDNREDYRTNMSASSGMHAELSGVTFLSWFIHDPALPGLIQFHACQG